MILTITMSTTDYLMQQREECEQNYRHAIYMATRLTSNDDSMEQVMERRRERAFWMSMARQWAAARYGKDIRITMSKTMSTHG